ncbi:MAG: hypothetical protein IPK10_03195 [Bacteroidetes bacterium]|nr:hypothetical protein [Bacteroidota bacterium]
MAKKSTLRYIVAVMLSVCFAMQTNAQVAIVSASAQSTNSFIYNATNGTNRLLLVMISVEYNGYNTVSGVTWGNKTFTSVGNTTIGLFTYSHTTAYYLKEADIASVSGNSMIVSSANSNSIRSISVKVLMLRGVLQTMPISEVLPSSTFFSYLITLGSSITSDTGDMVFATATSDRNNVSFSASGTGFFELFDLQLANLTSTVSFRPITASSGHSSPVFTGNQFSLRLSMLTFEVNSTLESLPVSFLDFSMKEKDRGLLFNWEVSMEENNEFFTLEESTDLKNWKEITIVYSLGNTQCRRSYDFFTNSNSNATYFRLSQTDFNGTPKILSTIYHKRKRTSIPDVITSSLSNYKCKAINLNGQIIASCIDCAPKSFISETFELSPLFVLELKQADLTFFRGIVSVESQ